VDADAQPATFEKFWAASFVIQHGDPLNLNHMVGLPDPSVGDLLPGWTPSTEVLELGQPWPNVALAVRASATPYVFEPGGQQLLRIAVTNRLDEALLASLEYRWIGASEAGALVRGPSLVRLGAGERRNYTLALNIERDAGRL
jgi:hypothetical protein